MDRDALYNEWNSMMFDGIVFFDKRLIRDFNKITDYNFNLYVEYQNHYLSQENPSISSFKSIRSKIKDFLMIAPDLNDINQEMIDNYFMSYLGKEKDETYRNRLNYIKAFFLFCKKYIGIEYDFEHLRLKPSEIETSGENTMKSLTVEQVSLCRQRYKDDLTKLYVFEMLYYTKFTKDDITRITYSNFDPIEVSFKYKSKHEFIPTSLAKIVEKAKMLPILNTTSDIGYIMEEMKEELKEYGIKNFKPKDLTATQKHTFWECPQCGNCYEAIVDNWCAKQFTDEGSLWIVCKERCGADE